MYPRKNPSVVTPGSHGGADLDSLRSDLAEHHKSIEALLADQLSRILEGLGEVSKQSGQVSKPRPLQQQPTSASLPCQPTPKERPNMQNPELPCEEASFLATSSAFSTGRTPKAAWGGTVEGEEVQQEQSSPEEQMVPKATFRLKLDKAKATGVREELERAFKLKSRKSLSSSDIHGSTVRRLAIRVVNHPKFEAASALLIVACTVFIGVETHLLMQNLPDLSIQPKLENAGILINAIFTLELILRVIADLGYFLHFSNASFGWNVLDTLLVVTGWVEIVLHSVQRASSRMDLSTLKLLRLLRLLRILRVVKLVRFFSELRILVGGIFGSMRSLVWAFVLLALVIFVFGNGVMAVIVSSLESESPPSAATTEQLMEFYGDLPRTMITLFMAISGGLDWGDAVKPLNETFWVMKYMFAAYVFFTVFCCLNVVTGIFVDHAKALKDADEEAMHQEAVKYRQHWIHEVAKIFAEISESNNGHLSKEEFIRHLEQHHVQVCFNKLGINTETTNTDELWDLFDMDESGRIDQDEFALGIKQFHGFAKSIDIFKLRRECLKMRRQVQFLKEAHVQGGLRSSRLSGKSMSSMPSI